MFQSTNGQTFQIQEKDNIITRKKFENGTGVVIINIKSCTKIVSNHMNDKKPTKWLNTKVMEAILKQI